MSTKSQQLDKDNFFESKNMDTSKSEKKQKKKTSDFHGYTEKSKKMVFIMFTISGVCKICSS